ncbi:ornithine cyclodeaminase [Kitasatospora gansuensis]|uniref:Ornithine cyclodeaminase n=1 Tax=Kitasatospora gansuensis TaxID=258050 RepID=A0A7W7SD56_9ACTN|nr:NAD(P)-binding domain-containing protein [Kitasatospora gansuensis]MBB4947708.1 ornithine cyclodeaminase [Kitasatospora gansuensis]
MSSTPPDLAVVPGRLVDEVLRSAHAEAKRLVEEVYVQSAQGRLVNPDSSFLRPDPEARERVIALPAYVPEPVPAMGIKWISSFPENLKLGLPRASAAIVLNDTTTGFPVALLEGARISGFRTALSALVGADALTEGARRATKFAVLGTGYISATTVQTFLADGWSLDQVAVFDLSAERAAEFVQELTDGHQGLRVTVADSAADALRDADLVLLATTAVTPHLDRLDGLAPDAIVLHMSLRDLTPEALAGAEHVVDEVSHSLREKTSLALAVEAGVVAREDVRPVGDLLTGEWKRTPGRTAVYAPFGLGSLDIALGTLVLARARDLPGVLTVEDFAGLAPQH